MTFVFDDLLSRVSAHEQRSFSASEFIQYAEDLLAQVSDYRDQWLDHGDVEACPSYEDCLSHLPLSYDELCYLVDGVQLSDDGTYLHWVTDPDSGATYLDELSIGPRTAPVPRELPRRPA